MMINSVIFYSSLWKFTWKGLLNYNSSYKHFEANILYIIVRLIIALRIIKCFNLIDTLNAFINKRLGLNVMANRVFGQNNLPAVREKQAVSQTRKMVLNPFFNFRPNWFHSRWQTANFGLFRKLPNECTIFIYIIKLRLKLYRPNS